MEEDYNDEDDDDDYYDDDDELAERRSPLIPILFAVGAAFVIATVFLLLKLVVDGFGPNSNTISVTSAYGVEIDENGNFFMPNIVGMTYEEAQNMYPSFKFDFIQEWSSEQAKDHIIATEPGSGVRHKITQKITVRVSKGKKLVEIRDLTNRQQSYAKEQLEKDGFLVKSTTAVSETIAAGYVISTQPPAHEQAEEGTVVTLVVSMGSKNSSVVMPKLTDYHISEANKICNENNIIIKVDNVPSEKPQGTVLEQSIPEGNLVEKGTEVLLSVSTGELPELEVNVPIALPYGYSGEYELGYFVDTKRDVSMDPDVREVSLSSTRSFTYTVKGKFGEKKTFALKLKSKDTGKEGIFVEYEIDFSAEKPVPVEIYKNSHIFEELQSGSASSESNTSDTTSSDTTSSDTTSSDVTSESNTTSNLSFSNLSDAELQSLFTILRGGSLGYGTATTSSYSYSSNLQSLLSRLGYGSNTNLSTNERQALLSALLSKGYGS